MTWHVAYVSHFFDFFEFLMINSKCGQNSGHGPSLLGVESCKNYYWIYDEIATRDAKNDFLVKTMNILLSYNSTSNIW
jgi:hypothetical protein